MIPKIYSKSRNNYPVHILRSQNTESGEPELNNIGEKYQDKNELILSNTIIYTIFKNCWYDSGVLSPSSITVQKWHVDGFKPIPFLKNMNIVSLYLFKRVAENMIGLLLSKQVARIIKSLSLMIPLITVSCILKEMYVELFPYLELKAPLTMTISMYYTIYRINTYTDTWYQY